MLKMNCPDMMAKTIDLLSACTMLDAAGTLIRILETLVDSMIKEHADASDSMQFCHPFVMPLVALLTQVRFSNSLHFTLGPTILDPVTINMTRKYSHLCVFLVIYRRAFSPMLFRSFLALC